MYLIPTTAQEAAQLTWIAVFHFLGCNLPGRIGRLEKVISVVAWGLGVCGRFGGHVGTPGYIYTHKPTLIAFLSDSTLGRAVGWGPS